MQSFQEYHLVSVFVCVCWVSLGYYLLYSVWQDCPTGFTESLCWGMCGAHLTNVYFISVCARESGLFEWSLCVNAAWHWLVFLGRWEGPALPLRFSAAIGIFPRHFWRSIVSCGINQWQHGTSYVSVLTWPWQVHVKPNTDPHKVICTHTGTYELCLDTLSFLATYHWRIPSPCESRLLNGPINRLWRATGILRITELQENDNADWLLAPQEYQDQIIQCESSQYF